jgi:hypothetical protein
VDPSWGFQYALDNGAWGAYQQQAEWPEARFTALVGRFGAQADWVVAPDIVMGGHESLAKSLAWLPALRRQVPRVLLAVQDGMVPSELRPHLGPAVGVFVGGSTEWKLETLRQWGDLCAELGAWCHIGRVNSVRRIKLCHSARAHSFDGTSVSQFACTLGKLNAATRLQTIPGIFDV